VEPRKDYKRKGFIIELKKGKKVKRYKKGRKEAGYVWFCMHM